MKFYNTYIRSRLCYCCETWTLTSKQYKRIETVHTQFLRRMVRGGMARMSSRKEIEVSKAATTIGDGSGMDSINWAWKHSNDVILTICQTQKIEQYIRNQNVKWITHVAWASNETLTKRLMFVDEKFTKVGYHHKTVYEQVVKTQYELGISAESFFKNCRSRKNCWSNQLKLSWCLECRNDIIG